MKNKEMINIYSHKWGYEIRRKERYYGSFKNKQTAIDIRDYLRENDWSISFHEPTILFLQGKYYIVNNVNNKIKVYAVTKTREEAENELNKVDDLTNIHPSKWGFSVIKNNIYYGIFKEKSIAKDIRDFLASQDWKIHFTELTIIHIHDKYYVVNQIKNRVKVYATAKTKQEAEKQLNEVDDMANIYKIKNSWAVHREVNKKRINYYTYQTLEEAKSMRDWLRKHDWNREEFEEEYSRRYPELPEYIYKTPDGRYMVRKNWKAGPQVYGRYNTLKKAISKRDYLIEHNWNVKIQRVIMEENGEWYVRQNTMINKKPYKKFYFKSESKEEVEQKYLQYKTEGLPQPFFITDKYRYIIHNRRMYYVRKHEIKYGYARTLKDAIILRTILENTGWKKPANGSIYIYEGTMYKIKYNNHGTPVFEKEIDAQYIRENNDDK